MIIFFRVSFLLLLLMPVSGLHAALVQQDWKLAGDGSIVYDNSSGLEWLKLGETVGETYNYVESQLTSGGEYEGFRFALLDEVQTLIFNAGATWGNCHPCPGEVGTMETFIDLIGSGYSYATGKSNWGYILSDNTPLGNVLFDGVFLSVDFVAQSKAARVTGSLKDRNPYSNLGGFIVRDLSPVPVPGAIFLFPLGLVVLSALQGRKANRSR